MISHDEHPFSNPLFHHTFVNFKVIRKFVDVACRVSFEILPRLFEEPVLFLDALWAKVAAHGVIELSAAGAAINVNHGFIKPFEDFSCNKKPLFRPLTKRGFVSEKKGSDWCGVLFLLFSTIRHRISSPTAIPTAMANTTTAIFTPGGMSRRSIIRASQLFSSSPIVIPSFWAVCFAPKYPKKIATQLGFF